MTSLSPNALNWDIGINSILDLQTLVNLQDRFCLILVMKWKFKSLLLVFTVERVWKKIQLWWVVLSNTWPQNLKTQFWLSRIQNWERIALKEYTDMVYVLMVLKEVWKHLNWFAKWKTHKISLLLSYVNKTILMPRRLLGLLNMN